MRHSRQASVVHSQSVYRLQEAPQAQRTLCMDVAGQFTAYVQETNYWNKMYTQDGILFLFPLLRETS